MEPKAVTMRKSVQIVVQHPIEAHYWVARQEVLCKPAEEPQSPGCRQQPYRQMQP
jgi:hypothetical protein